MFKKLDADNNGTLSKEELLIGYRKYFDELEAEK